MTKQELLKFAEDKFEKEFVGHDGSFCWELDKPYEVVPNLKSFLLRSLEEAYKAGEENMRETYQRAIKDTFPT